MVNIRYLRFFCHSWWCKPSKWSEWYAVLSLSLAHAVNCIWFCFWRCLWLFCLCMKYLWNHWTDLCHTHRENVFGPSLRQVWMSGSPRTKHGVFGRYLRIRWTDLRQIHTEDVFGLSLGRVRRSKVKVTRDKKKHFSAHSAACMRFMFG